jgi:hypothetical protein
MSRTVQDLLQLMTTGSSVDVSAASRPQDELVKLGNVAKYNATARLILRGLESKPQAELAALALIAKDKITFVFG